MIALVTSVALALAAPRVAVFGGSGFVGSRVCKTLVESGCRVASISRAGQPPRWAAAMPWSEQVEWLSADMLTATAIPLGRVDMAVSCVGNMRPSPDWEDSSFFGLHWNKEVMRRENGDITERIADAAKRAGATRFVYVSVATVTKWAYCGALGVRALNDVATHAPASPTRTASTVQRATLMARRQPRWRRAESSATRTWRSSAQRSCTAANAFQSWARCEGKVSRQHPRRSET